MLSPAAQAFSERVLASPELQQQLEQAHSPQAVFALAHAIECELTMGDFQTLAQSAYQHWLNQLRGDVQAFFRQSHSLPDLNRQLLDCQTVADVVRLAQIQNFRMTETDLQSAALTAATILGFSFEKLWFKRLGLLA